MIPMNMDNVQRLRKTIEFLKKRLEVYEPDITENLRHYIVENIDGSPVRGPTKKWQQVVDSFLSRFPIAENWHQK